MSFTDKSRANAAEFVELADANAAYVYTSEMLTENFMQAYQNAKHMVKGGGYSGGESQLVFNQLNKLRKALGMPTRATATSF